MHAETPTIAARRIPFSRVSCDGNEMLYLREVLESGWLTTASKTHRLEREFAEAVGARFAIAVNSCTSALHLALEAAGVGRGDKVLVPTMTFSASAEVIRYFDADPVFLDVEYGSCLLTPEIVTQALDRGGDYKALIVVHFAGQAARMLTTEEGPGILDICKARGVKVIEDAAHAFPARCGTRMVGALGEATCFSFYANKTMTTGEGGMLTTDDESIAARARLMRLHGIDRDVWARFTSPHASWEYDVVAPGFKYNMPDLNAAVGLAQLERAGAMHARRRDLALRYLDRLSDVEGLDMPLVHVSPDDHAWHIFVVVVRPGLGIDRNGLIEHLAHRGIGTSAPYKPLHRMTYYRERYGLRPDDYPASERAWKGCLALPLYPSLSDDDQDYVIDAVLEALTGRAPGILEVRATHTRTPR